MAIGDRLDLEFFLKRRLPKVWARLEKPFGQYRLKAAQARCSKRSLADDALMSGLHGYCAFAGTPRSGHSVLGTLLNAHRNILISHNLDALEYLRHGFASNEIFFLIRERDRQLAARERITGGYSYSVPGLHQGDDRALAIIGDKRAGATSRHLRADPQLLTRLPVLLGMPVYVIVHVRNPWDNISSIYTRSDIRRGRSLPEIADWYFELLDASFAALNPPASNVHAIVTRHEDLVTNPEAVLTDILRAFGLAGDSQYFQACRQFIHPQTKRTRDLIPWPAHLIDQIADRAAGYAQLAGYTFDE